LYIPFKKFPFSSLSPVLFPSQFVIREAEEKIIMNRKGFICLRLRRVRGDRGKKGIDGQIQITGERRIGSNRGRKGKRIR
jgi:hypothetical protein